MVVRPAGIAQVSNLDLKTFLQRLYLIENELRVDSLGQDIFPDFLLFGFLLWFLLFEGFSGSFALLFDLLL